MNKPTLSIIMPTYNRPTEMKVMIDSIIASTLIDWELVIVDDGSNEDVLELLASYERSDSRIKFHKRSRSPKGAQTCRNIGFELSCGDFVVFFDSDDYVSPECLARRVEAIKKNPDLDFIVFPSASMDSEGLHEEDWCNNFGYEVSRDDIEAFVSRRLPFVVWNNIYRRSSLEKYSISWDEKLQSFQDSDFNLSTLLVGMKYIYAKEKPNFYYRIPSKKRSSDSIVMEMFAKDRHQISHVYLTEKWISLLARHYNGKYNCALYDGIIFIIRFHFENTRSWHMGNMLLPITKKCSFWFWLKLRTHIVVGGLLQKILPSHYAFNIAFITYKIRDWIKAKLRIRRIKKTYYKNITQP